MRRLAYFALTLAAFVGMAATNSAQASTVDLGTLGVGTGSFTSSVSTGSFSNDYTFELAQNSNLSSSAGNLAVTLSFYGTTLNVLNISGLSLAVEDNTGKVLSSASSGLTLLLSNLKASTPYTLVVSGTGTGLAGGEYGVGYQVSAVPLPAALPLFGAAIVGLGVAARRRSKHQDA